VGNALALSTYPQVGVRGRCGEVDRAHNCALTTRQIGVHGADLNRQVPNRRRAPHRAEHVCRGIIPSIAIGVHAWAGSRRWRRLGLSAGKTEDEAVLLVREAVDMGINFVDTAPIYGTEVIVGRALKFIPRQSIVVATKASVGRNGKWRTRAQIVESRESSLRLLGTDHIDVFQLHGVPISAYAHARDTLVPTLIDQKAKGKIRHIGITELATEDDQHEMLSRAAYDGLWDVFMIAFHITAVRQSWGGHSVRH
jgi:predicted aldo/keto reductase-like oxidoreductase